MVWLNKVVTATVDSLLERIQSLSQLSREGSVQLHGDVDYLMNILDALGIEAKSLLGVTKLSLMFNVHEFETHRFQSLDERAIAKKIACIRGLSVRLAK